MEYIKIDPLEETLKAIGIVHGEAAERRVRLILARLESESQKALNAVLGLGSASNTFSTTK